MRRVGIYILMTLLVLPLTGQGQVLCIGVDGHVAIESAFNGKCCDAPQSARSVSWSVVSGPLTDFSDCGSCSDILIGSAVNSDRMARQQSSVSPALLLALVAVFDRDPALTSVRALHPPRQTAPRNNPLAHLLTVSLLV